MKLRINEDWGAVIVGLGLVGLAFLGVVKALPW